MKGKTCRIKTPSDYFEGKYGDPRPTIQIEDEYVNVFGRSWEEVQGNPAATLYALRVLQGEIPKEGKVYYGKIRGLGELVHETELEEIAKEKRR